MLFFFINHVMNEFMNKQTINIEYVKMNDFYNQTNNNNIYIANELFRLTLLEWDKPLAKNNLLLFSELLYITKSIVKNTNKKLKISHTKYNYLTIVSKHIFLENNHICLLHDLMTDCMNNIKIIKRILGYIEYKEWITLKEYLDSPKIEKEIFINIYITELIKSNLISSDNILLLTKENQKTVFDRIKLIFSNM